jgi:UDP-N-acetylglucosamine 2-epimerase
MNILIVVGAPPNFKKAAPIIAAIRRYNQGNASVSVDRDLGSRELNREIKVRAPLHRDGQAAETHHRHLVTHPLR